MEEGLPFMENKFLSIDDSSGGWVGIEIARDNLKAIPSYRVDPARIRIPEIEPRRRNGLSALFIGELAPAVESTAPESRETVAVKRLDWRCEYEFNVGFKSFAYELSLMTTLSHPNIVKLIGFVDDIQKWQAQMILSWEGNGNVRDFLQSGEWDIPERVSLIQDTVSGLEYLHARQPPIRHGDLKSIHILVSSSYSAIITGFGGARVMANFGDKNKDDHWLRLLCELELYLENPLYTLRWAAPEVLLEDLRCLPGDMWAIGWVCWEIVTGRIPFEDVEEDMAAITHLIQGNLPEIRSHAQLCQVPQLCDLMSGCWVLRPAERIDVSSFRRKARFVPSTTPLAYASGGPKVRSADLLLELGRMHDLRNDVVVAESYYQSALNIATRNENVTVKGDALIGLGRIHNIRSQYHDAERALMEAHELHSRIGNYLGAAYALIGLGEAYDGRSRCLDAEKALMEAHEIHSRIGNDLGVANALIGLGEVYGTQSRYPEAVKAFKEACNIHFRIGNDRGYANALIGLGDIHKSRSEYSEAKVASIEAREIHYRIGNDLGAANASTSLGEIYNALSRYHEAERLSKEAREIHSRIGNDLGVANALICLGWIYDSRTKCFEAEEVFKEAHKIHSHIGNNLGVANALVGLGEVYGSQSRYAEAEKAFNEARTLHSHVGSELGVANVLVSLGDIYDAQSRNPEAEKAFEGAHEIYSRIGNHVKASNALISLSATYEAQSKVSETTKAIQQLKSVLSNMGNKLTDAISSDDAKNSDAQSDSGDEECSEEAAELHLRAGTSTRQSETLSDAREIKFGAYAVDLKDEEPFKEALKIHLRIHNDSGNASAVDNPQPANFIQELASTIESVSMPSTQYIVNLILALAKTAPYTTRNKHQLYRILTVSCGLCYYLHRVCHAEGESRSGLDVLEQCWEIIDNLERTLLELNDIVSQEILPLGSLSLATWNNSRVLLSRIYGKLTAPPLNVRDVDHSADAMRDRYFDDCSWMSLLLLEGIELPLRSMHPEAEESFPIEAQNVIDRLNYLVNETKLNGNTDEPARELFIKIISDLANVLKNDPENPSADFWNAADDALQDIDLEKGLNQDMVDSLRDSWGRFADRLIKQVPAWRVRTPAPSQDPIAVSLPQDLTRLDHEITPAAEPLVLLLQSLGRGAPTVTRNKHKIYAIVSRARDICNDILAVGVRAEVSGLETLDEYYNLIDALEGILLDVARLLAAEQVSFGREMCVSWPASREEFCRILNRLNEPPFRLDLSAPKQELTKNSVFDDHYWLSLLLEGIEKELDRQAFNIDVPPAVVAVREGLRYLENEIKCGYHEESTRELVIDIASRFYEALSASVSEEGSDTALPIRTAETPPLTTLDKDKLVTALSTAFSVLDLESSLESQDIRRLADNWWGSSHSLATRRQGSLGETEPPGARSSSPVEPEGQGDQGTPQDSTQNNEYWKRVHNFARQRKLTCTRVEVEDLDSWTARIIINGEGQVPLESKGTGLSQREAREAAARLALVSLGEIVGEE